ncbi:uncharacterized protein LOC132309556 [Cornus florida]|uniref:uncharacterized protein LOC132309556 n=1 Tax=Cornus florida TaxID=4283 RepID=UPI00289A58BD|nr:uncharacterized protein LOC132309556 [Cornus florida]
MSPTNAFRRDTIQLLSHKLIINGRLCKSLAISGLVLYVIYNIFLFILHPCCLSSSALFDDNSRHRRSQYANTLNSATTTNISHLVFGIVGSTTTWRNKKGYIDAWWQPNLTRGYLFLDRPPTDELLPWPSSSPPFRVSEDTSRYKEYDKHAMPFAIRMLRVIQETFEAENRGGVRWYVMADDDTLLVIDNLVDVLKKYDHTKYYYIGTNSECVSSNFHNSFEMAFGGAGYALSYPLAEALAKNLDLCIKRYPSLYGSDHILQSCLADFGVSLTQEKGFHQIDLRRNILGLLSAHPHSPFLSLHHLDFVDPLFPSMNRHQSVNHLMEAAKADASRLLQQSVCYHKQRNWTLSISWGYTAQIYEKIFPPSILHRPLATFGPLRMDARPPYMFSTRFLDIHNGSCEAPHLFFFDSVQKIRRNHIVTRYTRKWPRRLPACSLSGSHSADHISMIHVLSPIMKHNIGVGSRRECCDVEQVADMNITVKLRACMKDEIVA